jgi:circadian clock protein KaiB
VETTCASQLPAGDFEVEIVDIRSNPERAERDRVVAIPTVVRTRPLPLRRVVGRLALETELAAGLELPLVLDW